MSKKSAASIPKEPAPKRQNWFKHLSVSDVISLVSVGIAVAALLFNIYDRNQAIEAEQFSQANQAFTQNKITADIKPTESGELGKQITSTFHNASPNPVFDLVLAMPAPLEGLKVSADQYHEFKKTDTGYEISFPTLAPGESTEFVDIYSQDLFAGTPPRTVINENFRFCFTDVNGQRWLADHQGAQKISSEGFCAVER